MDIIRTKAVKIRKPHVCFACVKKFPVGTTMELTVNADQGEIWNTYTCDSCVEVLTEYGSDMVDAWDNSYDEGCVARFLEEMNFDLSELGKIKNKE